MRHHNHTHERGQLILGATSLILVMAATSALAQVEMPSHEVDALTVARPSTTLSGRLHAGFRSVELDILDSGSWQSDPNGPLVAHAGPETQNDCTSGPGGERLGHCLYDILNWVDNNPTSEPLFVLVNMKGRWGGNEVAFLDEFIRNSLGTTLYSFEDLFLGYLAPKNGFDYPRTLANRYGWPMAQSLRGRVVVGLTGGQFGHQNRNMEDGLEELISGYGRYPATFLCPNVENGPVELALGGAIDGINAHNSQFFLCSNLTAQEDRKVTAIRMAKHTNVAHQWGTDVPSYPSEPSTHIASAHGIQDFAETSGGM